MPKLSLAYRLMLSVIAIAAFTNSTLMAGEQSPRIAPVEDAVLPLLAEGHFPGEAIAVLRDGEPVHVSTHGFASLAHNVPVTPETVFELASLTKHMTALAILDLTAKGKINLDDSIAMYVDDAPSDWEAITIDHLLSHTAGLEHRFEPMFEGEFLLDYSTDQMLAAAKAIPVRAAPGENWHYSDQGYFLLGVVIEKVTGRSFADQLSSSFFDAAGMAQTRTLDQSAIIPNLARGYIYENGELKRGRRVWQFGLTSHFGVMSSLTDLMRWEAALAENEGRLASLNPISWELQRKFSAGETCREWGYARGWWAVDTGERLVVHHAGYSGTAFIRDVTNGLSAIVLTNREISEGQLEPMAIAWAAINAVDGDIPATGYRCWE